MKVTLAYQVLTIKAPRSRVFQVFSCFSKEERPGEKGNQPAGNQPSENDEGATVVEREGNRLVVEFTSRDGRRLYRTLEEVYLYPEERITFRHLKGPLHHASEEFRFEEAPEGTRITYKGQIECRMPFLPGIGWLVALLYVRPKYGSVVKRHMEILKEAAESEALEAPL